MTVETNSKVLLERGDDPGIVTVLFEDGCEFKIKSEGRFSLDFTSTDLRFVCPHEVEVSVFAV